MESRAKAFGHAIHPMMIVLPLGLFVAAVVFDMLYVITERTGFPVASAYSIAAGVLGGVGAALFGWIDWFAIPSGTRAKRIGLVHGLGNAVVLVLFAASWLARMHGTEPAWKPNGVALLLSFVGIGLAAFTGWLGGELVERLAVSVDEGAGLNAPNSLSERHIHAHPTAG